MDRKSKQKIGFLCMLAGIFVLFAVVFLCVTAYENKIVEEQKQELTILYPQIAEPLCETVSYYAKMLRQTDLLLLIVSATTVMLILLMARIAVATFKKQKNNETQQELNYIAEQLLRFQNGDFIMPAPPEGSGIQNIEQVYERLRESGYYFSQLKERLLQEENSTKALITDISHQLKTPLASIRMSHELSLSADLSEEEKQSFLEAETREILKMEVLLDELVKLSRLENSMIQIKHEKCSLKKTIREAVSRVYVKAGAGEMEISVDMAQDREILHDHKWTVEALANILENAIKYSPPKTEIRIKVSYLVSHVLIQVEDEGIGIPEGERHEVFKRFYRGSNAKELVKEGAGVGLYLARSIIEQQGGTITVKSKTGNGSIFQITLPL